MLHSDPYPYNAHPPLIGAFHGEYDDQLDQPLDLRSTHSIYWQTHIWNKRSNGLCETLPTFADLCFVLGVPNMSHCS